MQRLPEQIFSMHTFLYRIYFILRLNLNVSNKAVVI